MDIPKTIKIVVSSVDKETQPDGHGWTLKITGVATDCSHSDMWVARPDSQITVVNSDHDTIVRAFCAFDPWPEPPTPIQRYEVRLADACEALHMSLNGSSDPLRPEEEMQIVEYLRTRLVEWDSGARPCAYDNAYRALLVATLAEYEETSRKRQAPLDPVHFKFPLGL